MTKVRKETKPTAQADHAATLKAVKAKWLADKAAREAVEDITVVKPVKAKKSTTAQQVMENLAKARAEATARIEEELSGYRRSDISTKRKWCAAGASLVTAYGAGYVLGLVANVLTAALFALTGSIFLYYVSWLIVFIAAFYMGAYVGQHVYNFVADFSLEKFADVEVSHA
jgi:hypothetical protein